MVRGYTRPTFSRILAIRKLGDSMGNRCAYRWLNTSLVCRESRAGEVVGETELAGSSGNKTRLLPPTIQEILASIEKNNTRANRDGKTIDTLSELTTLTGWVKSVRRMKWVTFVVVTDGSTKKDIQAIFRYQKKGEDNVIGSLDKGKGKETEKDDRVDKVIRNGASVRLKGVLTKHTDTAGREKEPEFIVSALEYVGDCPPETYPLHKKELSAAYLRDHCHLRTRTNKLGEMLRVRHHIQRGVQDWFDNEGFLYVHPPVITSNDCEGAGEAFMVYAPPDSRSPSASASSPQASPPSPSSSSLLQNTHQQQEHHFFNTPGYLTVSTQLHLEALAHSHGRVYTIGPAFRAEYSQTGRHLAEFWMVEAEWSWAGCGLGTEGKGRIGGVGEVCDVVEGVVKKVVERVVRAEEGEEGVREMFAPTSSPSSTGVVVGSGQPGFRSEETIASRARKVFALYSDGSEKWPRITYTDALELFRRAEGMGEVMFESGRPSWGEPLGSEHERWLAEKAGLREGRPTPVFVTHYPRKIKPFYMRVADKKGGMEEGETVECFDLLIPGIGELAGGSLREERVKILDEAMRIAGFDGSSSGADYGSASSSVESKVGDEGKDGEFGQYSWYRDLRVYGGAPHGGFGMGMERLVSALTGAGSVRECIPVPRWAGRIVL